MANTSLFVTTVSGQIGVEGEIRRTNEWQAAVYQLGFFINTLHLSKQQTEQLSDMVGSLIKCSEENAYCQGVVAGMEYQPPAAL